MGQYVLTRLLLMPLTLVLSLLLLFVLLNLAPGQAGDTEDPGAARERRESERAFREQFGLDQPIVLNTRPWTDEPGLRALLARVDHAEPRVRGEAQRELEELTPYAVPQLLEVARAAATSTAASSEARHAVAALALRFGEPGWRSIDPAAHDRRSAGTLLLDTRFARFWRNVLALDFGRSFVDRSPVLPGILARLQVSVVLGLVSILLAYALAIPLGVYSAARAGRPLDRALTTLSFVLYAAPSFFVGTVLLEALAAGHPWRLFPAAGFASLDHTPRTLLEHAADVGWHLVLPVATYTAAVLAALSRYARAGVAEVLRADHVRTAYAKGLPELVVLVRHVARNGMIPVLTLLAGLLPALVSGSVVIEVVFGVPGVGLYLYDAINQRDYNVVMGVLVIVSAATIVGTLLSDVAVALADPRVRLGRARA
jgi:peptide/nickel transport system permease protein